jgi:hypothetical protein
MMNSDALKSFEKTLDTVLSLLNRGRITAEVEKPIDQAAHSFKMKVKDLDSHSEFNRVVGAFVQHVYRNGLRLSRPLTDREALSEAIFLLEGHYQGMITEGYEGALLDGGSTGFEGIEWVLSRLAETIKDVELEKYVAWVFSSHIDHLDWEARETLVTVYLKKYQSVLPSRMAEADPARLVDRLHQLIQNHVSTDTLFNQIFGTVNETMNL